MWAPTTIFSDTGLTQEQFAWMLWEIMSHLSVFVCLNTYKGCPCIGSVRKFQPGDYLIMKLPQNQLCWSSNSTSLEIWEFHFSRLNLLSSARYLLLRVSPFHETTCCCVAADVLWLLAGRVAVVVAGWGGGLVASAGPGSSVSPCGCPAEASRGVGTAAAAFADCLVISSS